jgi:hypothetical protein
VAVLLPTFSPNRQGLWFARAETQFELAAITKEKKKFNHIISQLDYRHVKEVEDAMMSPPPVQEP